MAHTTTTTLTARRCAGCGAAIPATRLAAVPDTPWCVRCAEKKVQRLGGNLVWTHKTAPELELKPLVEAQRFAEQTRRHAYNASLRLDGMTAAMDRIAGVPPWEE